MSSRQDGEVELAEAVGSSYLLERELARGGMATVWLARDRRDGKAVAIKVMHPGVAEALGAERFRREIRLTGTMSHPLIVPLTDSGSLGELMFYVMPYVEGESLHQRLVRERRLPLSVAIAIAIDVASALGYAHSRGVLHRDVKPENILLAGGRALVADFGLARAIGSADSSRLTATGVVVGSAHYLSPEQIREDFHLDQRVDIYALGCVLHEMLTGAPPYVGRTLTELVTRILQAPVPSVRRLDPAIPEQVDATITRALARDPADRFPTMEAFADALPVP
jgi:serine/threonine-protein kinase